MYSAVGGGVAALYGPLHGGANEAVLNMLERLQTVHAIPAFLEGVKNRKEKLFGFGHRCVPLPPCLHQTLLRLRTLRVKIGAACRASSCFSADRSC